MSGSVRGASGAYSITSTSYGGMPYSPESAPHTGDIAGTPMGISGFSDMRGGVSLTVDP